MDHFTYNARQYYNFNNEKDNNELNETFDLYFEKEHKELEMNNSINTPTGYVAEREDLDNESDFVSMASELLLPTDIPANISNAHNCLIKRGRMRRSVSAGQINIVPKSSSSSNNDNNVNNDNNKISDNIKNKDKSRLMNNNKAHHKSVSRDNLDIMLLSSKPKQTIMIRDKFVSVAGQLDKFSKMNTLSKCGEPRNTKNNKFSFKKGPIKAMKPVKCLANTKTISPQKIYPTTKLVNQTVEEAPPATSKAFNTFKSIKEKSNLLKSIAGDVAKACRKSITKPIPFSFEERDKQRIERKNLLINKIMSDEREAANFKANPIPKSSLFRRSTKSMDHTSATLDNRLHKQENHLSKRTTLSFRAKQKDVYKPKEK